VDPQLDVRWGLDGVISLTNYALIKMFPRSWDFKKGNGNMYKEP